MFGINVYGHIDAMFYTLNAIAMVVNSPFFSSLLVFLTFTGISYAVVQGSMNPQSKIHWKHLFAVIVIINTLFLPKASLNIYDHVTKERDKVDNLPLGFVLPVGLLESISIGMTSLIEQAFSVTGSFNYTEYGSNFGASLIQESRNFRLQDPQLLMSMENFLERCILIPAAIGQEFTWDDLFKSDNLWSGLIKTKMKDGVREVSIYDNGAQKQMGCKSAYSKLDDYLLSNADTIKNSMRFTNFGYAGRESFSNRASKRNAVDTYFSKNVQRVFGNYLGQNTSGMDTIKQIMLIHQFSKFGDYGTLRTIHNQETSWQIAGKIASYYLPMLLTVLKCLLYASFLFILPMSVVTGSFQHYRSFFVIIASFQLWPALYSILNMFSDLYTADTLNHLATGGVTLATYSNITSVADKIVAVSGALQMSVPILAMAIAQGGLHSLVHMASNITSASMSTASGIAQEMTSGNRSFDNVNMQNVSGFKTDLNTSYKSGASEMQQVDGSISKITPRGDSFSMSGAGITATSAGYKFDRSSSMMGQVQNSITDQESYLNSQQSSFRSAQSSTMQQATNAMDDMSQNKSFVMSYAKESGRDDVLQQAKTVSIYDHLTKDKGYSKNEAYAIAAGISGGIGANNGLIKFGADGSMSTSDQTAFNDLIAKQKSAQNQDSVNKSFGVMDRLMQDDRFTSGANINKSHSEGFHQSYGDMKEYANTTSQAQDKLNSLQNARTQIMSGGANMSIDDTHTITQRVASRMGVGETQARRMLENGEERAIAIAQQEQAQLANATLRDRFNVNINPQNFRQESEAVYSKVDNKMRDDWVDGRVEHRSATRDQVKEFNENTTSDVKVGDAQNTQSMTIGQAIQYGETGHSESVTFGIKQKKTEILAKNEELDDKYSKVYGKYLSVKNEFNAKPVKQVKDWIKGKSNEDDKIIVHSKVGDDNE